MIEEQSILLGYELFKWVNGCSQSALVAFVDMSFIALRRCAYSNTAAGHRGIYETDPGDPGDEPVCIWKRPGSRRLWPNPTSHTCQASTIKQDIPKIGFSSAGTFPQIRRYKRTS